MNKNNKNVNSSSPLSVVLEHLSWQEAERILKEYDVVLFALGARTKEHGPHLPLNNDYLMAEYLKEQVTRKVPVVVLPTLQYGYYPSFLEYPGSISIKEETFRNMIIDICKSMHGYGVRKFYIINTGISTLRPLKAAANKLLEKEIILKYLNLLEIDEKYDTDFIEQEGGTHADEAETSMMLHIAPEVVEMEKAVKDYDPRTGRKGFTRDPEGKGTYSPTGIWGDPTLATKEKGKILTEAIIEEIVNQVKELMQL